MNNVLYLLVTRYLSYTGTDSSLKQARTTCFYALVLGTFVFSLTISIINGFHTALYKTLQGHNPQIIIDGYGQPLDIVPLQNLLTEQYGNLIIAQTPTIALPLLITNTRQQPPAVITLKAIDPVSAVTVTNLATSLIEKDAPSLHECLDGDTPSIIIGIGLCQEYGLHIGDTVILLFADEHQVPINNSLPFITHKARVTGIIKTGIEEIDYHGAYCSLAYAHSLNESYEPTTLELKLHDNVNEQKALMALEQSTGLRVYSWKELYKPLFSALALERYAMISIVLMIALLSATSIIGVLHVLLLQKKLDLIILMTMGMTHRTVRLLFTILGIIMSAQAISIGLILAWCISIGMEYYQIFFPIAELYYATIVHTSLSPALLLSSAGTLLLLCGLASLTATRNISSSMIAQILREEG